jgi:tetratricopeptide (TPR) repeat protein
MNNIAEIYIDQGRVADARPLLIEARATWEKAPYPIGVAVATMNLGRASMRVEDYAATIVDLESARRMFEEINSGYYLSECDLSLTERLLRTQRTTDLVDEVDRVMAEVQAREGDENLHLALLRMRAVALARRGDFDTALTDIESAVHGAEVSGYLFDLALALQLRVDLGQAAGNASDPRDQMRATNLFSSLGVIDALPWDVTPSAGHAASSAAD